MIVQVSVPYFSFDFVNYWPNLLWLFAGAVCWFTQHELIKIGGSK